MDAHARLSILAMFASATLASTVRGDRFPTCQRRCGLVETKARNHGESALSGESARYGPSASRMQSIPNAVTWRGEPVLSLSVEQQDDFR